MIKNEEFIQEFIEEAIIHVESVDSGLLALEEDYSDHENINNIFRAVHSIKGTASFLALGKIVELSHYMEDILSKIRNNTLSVSHSIIDVLLSSNDTLKLMVEDVMNSENVDIVQDVKKLSDILESSKAAACQDKSSDIDTKKTNASSDNKLSKDQIQSFKINFIDIEGKTSKAEILKQLKKGGKLYKVQVITAKENVSPEDIIECFKKVESIGKIISSQNQIDLIKKQIVENEENPMRNTCISFVLLTVLDDKLLACTFAASEISIETISTPSTPDKIIDTLKMSLNNKNKEDNENKKDNEIVQETKILSVTETLQETKSKVQNEEVKIDMNKTFNEEEVANDDVEIKSSKAIIEKISIEDSIRVHVSLLNDVLNLASEMVLGRNQLLRTIEDYRKNIPGIDPILQNIDHITTELQEKVMQTRMQPISNVFNKFPRIIRELSKTLNKEIELSLEGAEVELDKSIIESLGDPLVHLVRNSADHGLELPETREQNGKPAKGTITLKAYHESGYVNIDIIDDGAGIKIEKVKGKALDLGVVTTSQVSGMSEQDIIKLLFRPGFSTADKITNVSGRGVGLDVVKANIEKLGGTIEVYTKAGQGTTFRLILPLTLAIIPSLIVEVENQKFALPQVNLQEIVRIKPEDVSKKIGFINNSEVLHLRGRLLPIVHLSDVLGLKRTFVEHGSGKKRSDKRKALHDKRGSLPSVLNESGDSFENLEESRRIDSSNTVRILVLKNGQRRFGIVVDVIHEGEEILVKQIPRYLKDCKYYSGVTILGDGKIAMILDLEGIIDKAKLFFGDERLKKGEGESIDHELNTSEVRNLLLFKCTGTEIFAMDISMVARIEKINLSNIEKIGDKEYIKYNDDSMRIIRPEDFLPVSHGKNKKDHAYVIIPKAVRHPIGVMIEEIHDNVQTDIKLNTENIKETGLYGSMILNNNLVLMINAAELFKKASPEHYLK